MEKNNHVSKSGLNPKPTKKEFRLKPHKNVDKSKTSKLSFNFGAVNVFKLLFLLILVWCLVSTLIGNPLPTFDSFLNGLANVPQVSTDVLNWSFNISWGDWGIFEGLKRFCQLIFNTMKGFSFIAACIVDCLSLVLYFLQWLFW